MKTASKHNTLQFLSSIDANYQKFDTKLAILSFHNQSYSRITEAAIIFLEYFQLVAQAFLFNISFYPDSDSYRNPVLRLILGASKLVHPGSFLPHNDEKTYNTVLSIVLGLLALKYTVTGYVCYIAHKNKRPGSILIRLWRWIFKLQGRVIYILITSVLMEVALSSMKDEVKTYGLAEPIIVAICVLIICMEYIFSLILQIRLCYVLPTKSILSAKDSILENSVLTQKFLTQFLQLSFSTFEGSAWIIAIFNLIFSLARIAYFFRILPIYNVKILLYQGALVSIVGTANLACLIQTIADSTDQSNIDIDSVLVFWIITSILITKIVHGSSNYFVVCLAENRSDTLLKLLVHKVHALKQLVTLKTSTEFADKLHWTDLINATVKSNAVRILNLDENSLDEFPEDINSKDSIQRMSIQYLESLLRKFPNSDLIKLYVIYYYAKKLKNYGLALKMINDVKPNSSKRLLLNASLLLSDIQNMEIFVNSKVENKLDFSIYVRNVSAVAKWKSYMLEQVDLQMALCEETMSEMPDLAKLYTLAQKMYHYRHAVEKKTNTVFTNIPGYYIEPYMIYAHYQLVVNHSVHEYRDFVRYHYKKYKQYEKYFKSNKMLPENLYHNTGFAIFSAQKASFGRILFCTKGVADIFGGDKQRYLGNDIGIFSPTVTRPFYASLYRSFVDTRNSNAETSVYRSFSQHKDGHVFEVDFSMDVSLFEGQGLCFCGVARKVVSDKDYLLVNENGEIEGVSSRLGRRLGLFNQKENKESKIAKINISSISYELGKANEAFNMITLQEKYQPKSAKNIVKAETDTREDIMGESIAKFKHITVDLDEATKLHETFSTEGKEVVLRIPSETAQDLLTGNQGYKYICTITTTDYGTFQLKTFILEEIEMDLENMVLSPPLIRKSTTLKLRENGNNMQYMETFEKDQLSPRKDTEGMNFEDEKEKGWIDLSPFESERPPRLFSLLTENNKALTSVRTQEDNLLSPTSQRLLSHRNLLSQPGSSTVTPKERQIKIVKRGLGSDRPSKTATVEDEASELSISDIIKPEQSITSQMSASSHSDATLKAYKTALLRSTIPRSFKILCFCFYLGLVLLLWSQLNLKNSLDNFLKTLELKKNILGHSSNRDTAVASIHGNANSLWPSGVRVANGENTASLNSTIARYINSTSEQLAKVDVSNHDLLLDMQFLDEETRELFFYKDVRIYDTFFDATKQVVMNYSNFKAIDRILETGARAIRKAKARDFVTSKDDFFFLFRNPENDLLIKSAELGKILDQSLTDERESAQDMNWDYLITTLVLLSAVGVALCVLIWKQYLTERNNLLAFVKLDPQSIQTIHSRLIDFKYKVENEKSFEKTTIDLAEYLQPTMKKNAKAITVHKKHLQTANYWGIFKKYLLHTLKLIVFILIIMALVLWSNISAKISIQFFHKKQAQLKLSGQMKYRSTLTAVVSEELLTRNNQSQILNQWTASLSPSSLEDLANLREDAREAFMEDNGEYDPVIADILFNTGRCDLFPDGNTTTCQTLAANGILSNYMSVLTNFEKLLRNRYERYVALPKANRTTTALSSIRSQNSNLFRPLRLTLEYQSDAIFKLINTAFEGDLAEVAEERNMIFTVITVCLGVLSVIAWFSLLRILKDSNNKFKKVLQSLPAHIVLQSFLLRLFLMGNSIISLKNLATNS